MTLIYNIIETERKHFNLCDLLNDRKNKVNEVKREKNSICKNSNVAEKVVDISKYLDDIDPIGAA